MVYLLNEQDAQAPWGLLQLQIQTYQLMICFVLATAEGLLGPKHLAPLNKYTKHRTFENPIPHIRMCNESLFHRILLCMGEQYRTHACRMNCILPMIYSTSFENHAAFNHKPMKTLCLAHSCILSLLIYMQSCSVSAWQCTKMLVALSLLECAVVLQLTSDHWPHFDAKSVFQSG